MSGIVKCLNGCPKRLLCRRWTAPSSYYQTIAPFKPDPETGICPEYWPNQVALAALPTNNQPEELHNASS